MSVSGLGVSLGADATHSFAAKVAEHTLHLLPRGRTTEGGGPFFRTACSEQARTPIAAAQLHSTEAVRCALVLTGRTAANQAQGTRLLHYNSYGHCSAAPSALFTLSAQVWQRRRLPRAVSGEGRISPIIGPDGTDRQVGRLAGCLLFARLPAVALCAL